MPKLRVFSGKDVIKIFTDFGFIVVSQRGSHVKLRRFAKDGSRQTLTIPNHSEIGKNTLKAIYNQSLRYIRDEDLRSYFYGDKN